MSKHNFNKKIKFYRELIDNINLLTSNKETKYEVLNNTFNLINALGANKNLSIRKMGKQLELMMYCDGQLNLVSSAIINEIKKSKNEKPRLDENGKVIISKHKKNYN